MNVNPIVVLGLIAVVVLIAIAGVMLLERLRPGAASNRARTRELPQLQLQLPQSHPRPEPVRLRAVVVRAEVEAVGRNARHNKPANTDPQQHKAASPQMLVVRLPLR
jgi:hypothetical protein